MLNPAPLSMFNTEEPVWSLISHVSQRLCRKSLAPDSQTVRDTRTNLLRIYPGKTCRRKMSMKQDYVAMWLWGWWILAVSQKSPKHLFCTLHIMGILRLTDMPLHLLTCGHSGDQDWTRFLPAGFCNFSETDQFCSLYQMWFSFCSEKQDVHPFFTIKTLYVLMNFQRKTTNDILCLNYTFLAMRWDEISDDHTKEILCSKVLTVFSDMAQLSMMWDILQHRMDPESYSVYRTTWPNFSNLVLKCKFSC